MSGTGKYEPLVWQIVKDRLGYDSIHETNEDGGPGDIVCDVYGDHGPLILAAPELLEALAKAIWLIDDKGIAALLATHDPVAWANVADWLPTANAAIAKATRS